MATARAREAVARELRARGVSDVEIARQLEVSRRTLLRWLGPRRPADERESAFAAALADLATGPTLAAAAGARGLSRGALRRRAREAGLGPRPTGLDAARRVMAGRLRADGLSDRQIALRLGVPRRRLSLELGPPPLAGRAERRLEGHAVACVRLLDVGTPRDRLAGLLGVSEARVERALALARRLGLAVPRRRGPVGTQRRLWTDADLRQKARDWGALYDRPPSAPEWNPWHRSRWRNLTLELARIERFYAAEWPYTSSVIDDKCHRPWGTSWNAFLQEAGFDPLPHGYHYATDDEGRAIRVDGRRLIRANGQHSERLEGDVGGARGRGRRAAEPA